MHRVFWSETPGRRAKVNLLSQNGQRLRRDMCGDECPEPGPRDKERGELLGVSPRDVSAEFDEICQALVPSQSSFNRHPVLCPRMVSQAEWGRHPAVVYSAGADGVAAERLGLRRRQAMACRRRFHAKSRSICGIAAASIAQARAGHSPLLPVTPGMMPR